MFRFSSVLQLPLYLSQVLIFLSDLLNSMKNDKVLQLHRLHICAIIFLALHLIYKNVRVKILGKRTCIVSSFSLVYDSGSKSVGHQRLSLDSPGNVRKRNLSGPTPNLPNQTLPGPFLFNKPSR